MRPRMPFFRSPKISVAAALLATLLMLDVHTAQARGKSSSAGHSRQTSFEIFASLFFDDALSESNFGLRGSYFLSERLAVEGAVQRFTIDSDFDIFLVDFSAKYYLRRQRRSAFYLIGGPGVAFEELDDIRESPLFLHLGFGADISLGRNFYLRPELRARWVEDDLETSGGDLSLGFGWSF